MTKTGTTLPPSIERYILAITGIVVINIGLLFFLRVQVKTIRLLQDQKTQLQQDLKIVNSSEEIYNKYKNDIEEISNVFPSEEEVLTFLQTLENLTKQYSDDSVVKFASLSPQPDGDMLFLLFSISMRTDKDRLNTYLTQLEKLPYMTRMITLSTSFPNGPSSPATVSINLKLYVKNPFSAE